MRFRIVTYNVHKCRGLDRRIAPERIAQVLHEVDADVIAMQEILRVTERDPEHDQVAFIAERLGMQHVAFGHNRPLAGGTYGNATISRLPIVGWRNYDITHARRERRGCLRTDVGLPSGRLVHVINLHLGTGFMERRAQAQMLMSPDLLLNAEFTAPRVVVGDFNEWTRGLTSRMLSGQFKSAELRPGQPIKRSYPGVLPLLHLDHVYHDESLRLTGFYLHRSRTALIASDHLPLVADLEVVRW